MTKRSKFCLIGIPDDDGIRNVGGRLGACRGPGAFRKALLELNSRHKIRDYLVDCGDVIIDDQSIQKTHQSAAQKIALSHAIHNQSLVIGGGHDHGHSQLVGIKNAYQKNKKNPRIGCINIDAHLDVREAKSKITSGSPFYMAMENKTIRGEDLIEFGIQPHCNNALLWEYADKHKIKILELSTLQNGKALSFFKKALHSLSKRCDAIVIQLDLDAFASAFAPGVSAPQANGFHPGEIYEILSFSKKNKKVISLGIFELNPEHDQDAKTAKLAAHCAYYYLLS